MNMIRPHKHMNPDRSVLALAATLLKRLQRFRVEKYSSLIEYAKQENQDGDALFVGAISLLYLLGLIEYKQRNDSFEYVGP